MSIVPFQLVNNQTFLPVDVSGGNVFVSPEQANGVGTDLSTGILVVADYHDFQSASPEAVLQAVVEGKSEQGQFYNLIHQFEEFSLTGVQQRRQLILSQDLELEQGTNVDNVVTVGGVVTDQVSRYHGVLPPVWRVRVNILDPGLNFVSLRMSIYGQRFSKTPLPGDFRGVLVDTDDLGTLVTTKVL